jgi:hypothetical protein
MGLQPFSKARKAFNRYDGEIFKVVTFVVTSCQQRLQNKITTYFLMRVRSIWLGVALERSLVTAAAMLFSSELQTDIRSHGLMNNVSQRPSSSVPQSSQP